MQHSELQDQIPLYALGGLAADESARVAEHLEICPACRGLMSEYQFVADELLTQAPMQTAPARIGVRLQNLAEQDVRNGFRSRTPPRSVPAHGGVPFWKQRFALPRWAFALALLGLVFLLGVTGALALQMQRSNSTADQVTRLLTTEKIKYVTLTRASGAANSNVGFLCLAPDNATALLWLYDLEPLDHDHVYQVWLRDNGSRANGGTFRPDYDGRAIVLINAPQPLRDYKEIGVTVEPASGSTAPTTPRVIGGKLN